MPYRPPPYKQCAHEATPDGACAVDPLNPDGIDPDEITRRTGEKDGEPSGEPETDRRGREKSNSLDAQDESADILAADGFPVELLPNLSAGDLAEGLSGGKNPDLRVDGKIYDVYAPRTDNTGSIRRKIQEKVSACQAFRVVVNLSLVEKDVSIKDIITRIDRQPIRNLRELIIIDKAKKINHFIFLLFP